MSKEYLGLNFYLGAYFFSLFLLWSAKRDDYVAHIKGHGFSIASGIWSLIYIVRQAFGDLGFGLWIVPALSAWLAGTYVYILYVRKRMEPEIKPKELIGAEAISYANTHLKKVSADTETSIIEYVDEKTGEKWLMDYSGNEQHAVVIPRLRKSK